MLLLKFLHYRSHRFLQRYFPLEEILVDLQLILDRVVRAWSSKLLDWWKVECVVAELCLRTKDIDPAVAETVREDSLDN